MEESSELNMALSSMDGTASNFAAHFIYDVAARKAYNELTTAKSAEIRRLVGLKKLTVTQGRDIAHQMRGELLEFIRARSSPIAQAKARDMKKYNKTLAELLDKYSDALFKKPWSQLSKSEAEAVGLEIIEASGRPNPKVNATIARLSKLARVLWFVSLAIAILDIAVAENKIRASFEAAGSIGGGIAGGFVAGFAAGAVAGSITGPGAIIAAVVGGIIGSIAGGEFGKMVYDDFQQRGVYRDGDFIDCGMGEKMGRDGSLRPSYGPKF